jgi:hypothetical protein
MSLNRRQFLAWSSASLALCLGGTPACRATSRSRWGPLETDPDRILDLPPTFNIPFSLAQGNP